MQQEQIKKKEKEDQDKFFAKFDREWKEYKDSLARKERLKREREKQ